MNIQTKKLQNLRESIHKYTMEYLNIVTEAAGQQMKVEGITFNPENIDLIQVVKLAAKRLDTDVEELKKNYMELMLLEKMIEIV